MKKYVLFDLDGTLTDPGVGIVKAVQYALEKFGITETDTSQLYKFIGPPLWDSFSRYYGFSKEQADEAVRYYREYYNDEGIFENAAYEGIDGLLETLSRMGRTLVVATSKPTVSAERVLRHFGLDGYFAFVAGSEFDGTRSKKAEVIAYALANCNIEPSQAVMVGDREHDVIGAKQNGVPTVGVLYGYGDRAELEAAGADFIVKDIGELEALLCGEDTAL